MSGKSLSARIDAVSAAYGREFAGKDRRTRDVQRLDQLLAEARAVAGSLERKIGALRADEKRTLARATHLRDLLTSVRREVIAEKTRPPPSAEELAISEPSGRAAVYATLLRVATQRAGGRVDLALLDEVLEGVGKCEADMVARTPSKHAAAWMLGNLNTLRSQLTAYRQQREQLAEQWSAGNDDARRAISLQLADDLLALHRDDERMSPPALRRPARLQHLARTAARIADQIRTCRELTGGEADALTELGAHARALTIAVDALTSARSTDEGEGLRASLEAELATLATLYRENFSGRSRKDVDLRLIEELAIRSANVAIQAADLWNERPDASREALRRLSRERHHSYQAEEQAVRGWKEGKYK